VCSSEDPPCTEPAAGVTLRFLRGGVLVAQARTDVRGHYRVPLVPGSYTVRLRQATVIGSRIEPASVRVRTGWRHVNLSIDTGIR
jgi:hypothetical protein